ncbi:unnamed protein product [Protopolystoma xenopodis]|uniref:Uncharacterized protein n=1 Tax=Protopolystoma xenopodis TaxID=117903 RepID=A0A3S5FC28_9PLAT|nr:unnamed protein product [Protopolystoma xenopodis]
MCSASSDRSVSDAGETFENVPSPLSDAGNDDNHYGRRLRTRCVLLSRPGNKTKLGQRVNRLERPINRAWSATGAAVYVTKTTGSDTTEALQNAPHIHRHEAGWRTKQRQDGRNASKAHNLVVSSVAQEKKVAIGLGKNEEY